MGVTRIDALVGRDAEDLRPLGDHLVGPLPAGGRASGSRAGLHDLAHALALLLKGNQGARVERQSTHSERIFARRFGSNVCPAILRYSRRARCCAAVAFGVARFFDLFEGFFFPFVPFVAIARGM